LVIGVPLTIATKLCARAGVTLPKKAEGPARKSAKKMPALVIAFADRT
jgi:hypothetical protein